MRLSEKTHFRGETGVGLRLLRRCCTSTMETVSNLGLLYAGQGRMAQAEQMYVRALRGYEKALGPDHAWTLDNNFGMLYQTKAGWRRQNRCTCGRYNDTRRRGERITQQHKSMLVIWIDCGQVSKQLVKAMAAFGKAHPPTSAHLTAWQRTWDQ